MGAAREGVGKCRTAMQKQNQPLGTVLHCNIRGLGLKIDGSYASNELSRPFRLQRSGNVRRSRHII
jgi:hypothetical protein